MNSETARIISFTIIGSLMLFSFLKNVLKSQKCVICAAQTKSHYRDQNDTIISLCKIHLLERWKTDVISSRYNMIMIEPDLIKYPYAYLYATVETLKKWSYTKEDQHVVSVILGSIAGNKCKECEASAAVAYFTKNQYTVPNLAQLPATPTFLCKKCAVEKTEYLLRNAPKEFAEGLYSPTDGPGIYHVQEF